MLHRDLRRGHGKLDEAPHFFYFPLFDVLQRVKVLYLGGDGCGKARRIEFSDPCHSAAAGEDVRPCFFRADTESTDQSHTCYYNSARQIFIPPAAQLESAQVSPAAQARYRRS